MPTYKVKISTAQPITQTSGPNMGQKLLMTNPHPTVYTLNSVSDEGAVNYASNILLTAGESAVLKAPNTHATAIIFKVVAVEGEDGTTKELPFANISCSLFNGQRSLIQPNF